MSFNPRLALHCWGSRLTQKPENQIDNGVVADPAEGLHLSVEASAAAHHRGREMWSIHGGDDRRRRLQETRSETSIMSTYQKRTVELRDGAFWRGNGPTSRRRWTRPKKARGLPSTLLAAPTVAKMWMNLMWLEEAAAAKRVGAGS